MSTLKLRKVNSLPGTLEPSTLYLVKPSSGNTVAIFITDKTGAINYHTLDSTDVSQITMAIINSLINQPNGIAGLDDNGNISVNVDLSSIILTSTDATPPGANSVKLFRNEIANRDLLGYVNSFDKSSAIQPFIANNRISIWSHPGNSNSSSVNLAAPTFTITGTLTTRNVAVGSLLTMSKRLGIVSNASGGSLAGYRIPNAQHKIGGGDGRGGFFLVHRFAISDNNLVTGGRMFLGARSSTGSPSNVNPSTITNCIGIGHGAGDTTLKLYYGGSVPQTPIDLGIDFPVTSNTDIYELILYSPINEYKVYYQVNNINSGAETSGELTGTEGTILPATTTLLSLMNAFRSNNTTGQPVGIDIMSLYIETEY